MEKLKLSKHSLQEQRNQLKLYNKLLPSLDLKQRQLMSEVKKAQRRLTAQQVLVNELQDNIGTELPMLANQELNLQGLVTLQDYQLAEENIAGVRIPVLANIACAVADYSAYVTPPWVDLVVKRLRAAVEENIRLRIITEQVTILQQALRKITQRVNLFEKILIPTTTKNIKRIQIFLGDYERSAVVIAKLAKRMQSKIRVTMQEGLA